MTPHALALFLPLLLYGVLPCAEARGGSLRVACVGRESDASEFLTGSGDGSYPAELRRLLGPGYNVSVFRTGGGPVPDSALSAWSPDIVILEPGTVDSAGAWGSAGAYTSSDLAGDLSRYASFRPKPRIMLLIPLPDSSGNGGRDSVLVTGTIPRIRTAAYDAGCEVVDIHSMFLSNDEHGYGLPEITPGAPRLIAGRLKDLIRTEEEPGFDIGVLTGIACSKTEYYGYECLNFTFAGREARIVRPKRTARGGPWIWRARFWGHEPQTEIALLERGFHVAYCDVAELFGNDEAAGIWDRFYDLLTGAGLAKKTVLEGLSRGGMYIYRWAVRHPSRVACVYADAPVLDMKSWPGGKGKGGGNPVEWQRFKDDFLLRSEAEALAFRGNPLDMAPGIARGGFPMIHVCGLADVVVPIEENTDPFEKKIVESGGRITVLRKPGIGHHPHSFPNPLPIVRFILESTGRTSSR